MHPDVLTLQQTSTLVAMPTAVVRRHAASGAIPGIRIGRPWRFWSPSVLHAVTGVRPSPRGEPPSVDVVDAAALGWLLGIPERTVCVLLRRGELPGHKVAGRWRSHWPTIAHHLREGVALPGPPAPQPVHTTLPGPQ